MSGGALPTLSKPLRIPSPHPPLGLQVSPRVAEVAPQSRTQYHAPRIENTQPLQLVQARLLLSFFVTSSL